MTMLNEFKDKRVTVMGLGLFGGGGAIARFLAGNGAIVTVTDLKDEKKLASSVEKLRGARVRFVLGRHDEKDFTDADVIIVNPAVPKESPYLRLAAERGVRLETEMNLFFKLCPAAIVGITGSNGKTTTTTLTGEMLKALGTQTQARGSDAGRTGTVPITERRRAQRDPLVDGDCPPPERSSPNPRVYVGGNIGSPLIERVGEIKKGDLVVLELSSFQLEDLRAVGRSPHVAVVTNIAPNHLDRHKTMENYVAAKKAIIDYQTGDDYCVLNALDETLNGWAATARARVLKFSSRGKVEQGTFLDGNTLRYAINGKDGEICGRDDILLPGIFNVENYLAASAAAIVMGVKPEAIREVARTFRGVPHRLEMFFEKNGVRYYNDSIATTPESVIAALDALKGTIVLIAGGYDKKVSLAEVSRKIAQRCKAVVLIGVITPQIKAELLKPENKTGLKIFEEGTDFDAAVKRAISLAEPGGCVLLSPTTASYDMFTNFEERGEKFKSLVQTLA